MSFFKIHVTNYTLEGMTTQLTWPDVDGERSTVFEAQNLQHWNVLLIAAQTTEAKSILKRYISQRCHACTLENKYSRQLGDCDSLSMLAKFTRQHLQLLKFTLMPKEESKQHAWRHCIPPLLEFLEYYQPGDAFKTNKQIVTNLTHQNYVGTN